MTNASKKHAIGIWTATALVIGNIIGAGIYSIPVSLAPYGAVSILGWLASSVGAIALALVFASLSRRDPDSGGPYSYTRRAFGDFVGFQMAWGYWAFAWISNSAFAIAATSYLSVLYPTINENRPLAFAIAASIVVFATAINVVGVKQTAVTQLVLTVLKLAPLVVIGLFGLFYIKMDHFVPFNPSGGPIFPEINAAAMITLWAFIGLESATIPAEHVKDAHKTIARATIIGTLISAVLYMAVTIAVLGIVSRDVIAQSAAPIALAADVIFNSPSVGVIFAIGAIISSIGALVGWTLIQAQMPYAAAKDGLFPQVFSKLSSRGVPVFGVVFSSLLLTVFMATNYTHKLSNQFTEIVTLSTFVMLVPYLLSSMAELLYLFQKKTLFSYPKILRASVITVVAIAYSLWLILGAGHSSVLFGIGLYACGIPVYLWMRRKQPAEEVS